MTHLLWCRYPLFLLTSLSFAVHIAMSTPAWAGGAGPCPPPQRQDCSEDVQVCKSGPSAGLECFVDADCPGSKCIATTFRPDLPRVCANDETRACFSDSECVQIGAPPRDGKCVIAFAEIPKADPPRGDPPKTIPLPVIHATLTLIVDDDEQDIETEFSRGGAATILLEVENGNRRSMLAQAFVAMDQNYPEVEFLRTEALLNDAVVDASLLNRLLFRDAIVSNNDYSAEAGFELGQALRELFSVAHLPVRPVIVGVPERIRPVDYADHGAGKLASVVQLRIAMRFVRVVR